VGGWGGETATAAVGNTPRTMAAWLPVWMRGEKRRGACDLRMAMGRRERGEGEREERAGAAAGSF
jgi:hypothetical protein